MIKNLNKLFLTKYSRKTFLKILSFGFISLLLATGKSKELFAKTTKQLEPREKRNIKTNYDLVAVHGDNIEAMAKKIIDELGGIEKFVKKGDTVVIKPNIGWNREPEYAANTNPVLVAAVVKLCLKAGAKKVKVFDNTCNEEKMCYKNSGIEKAVKEAGGDIFFPDRWKYYAANFKTNAQMQDFPVYADAVNCDCFINIPIAKTHGHTKLTLSIKNLMGVCGGNRSTMHWNIDKKLPEVLSFIKPDLNIIDGYRILVRNGPRGGNLEDVKKASVLIASADAVLADSYASQMLYQINPEDIGHIKEAAISGLGNININKANIKKLKI
ncbi:MAG: DUF362 domain-containing protein [Endomicrobiaceae bacterium]